jgi:WhiB family transcriptional regulator, redox-sensing transcriptional regulator
VVVLGAGAGAGSLRLSDTTRNAMRWMDRAACRGADLNLFYAVHPLTRDPLPEALAYCDRCAVAPLCLDWAMRCDDAAYAHGTWGGTSPRGRQRLNRRIRRRTCPLCASTTTRLSDDDRTQICLDCGTSWTLTRPGPRPGPGSGQSRVNADTAA